ncbi:MAG: phosphodiester glycosidase family protein [Lentisphaeria bacterium]|nr:phosphodiester glycosidase family protein [Lentisphaeria bacterium]
MTRRCLQLFFTFFMILAFCQLHAEDIIRRKVGPGVEYSRITRPGPYEIRLIHLKRKEPLSHLEVVMAFDRLTGDENLRNTIARFKGPKRQVVGGTNGDFFHMAHTKTAGMTVGVSISNGRLVESAGNLPCFYVTADRVPHIGPISTKASLVTDGKELTIQTVNRPPTANGLFLFTRDFQWDLPAGLRLRLDNAPLGAHGDWKAKITGEFNAGKLDTDDLSELVLVAADNESKALLANLKPDMEVILRMRVPEAGQPVVQAVGGNFILLKDGELPFKTDNVDKARHPRTTIGFNDEEIMLMTVDGRQPGWSVGMRYEDLAVFMKEFGMKEALNLDGGGSTTAIVRDVVENRPSDGGLRRNANGVIVVSEVEQGPLATLEIHPKRLLLAPGLTGRLQFWPGDVFFNPVEVKLEEWELIPAKMDTPFNCVLKDGAVTLANIKQEGTAAFIVRHKQHPEISAPLEIEVVHDFAKLVAVPASLTMCPEDKGSVKVFGENAQGNQVEIPVKLINWKLPEASGFRLGQPGEFIAEKSGARTQAVLSLGKASCQLPLNCTTAVSAYEFKPDMELPCAISPAKDPLKLESSVQEEDGQKFLRMAFNLGEGPGTRSVNFRPQRKFETTPIRLRLKARVQGEGTMLFRVIFIDSLNSTHYLTFHKNLPKGGWQDVNVRPPVGMRAPVVLSNIYIVNTMKAPCNGTLDIKDIFADVAP